MSMIINSGNFENIDYNFKVFNIHFLRGKEENQTTGITSYFENIRIEL